MDKTETSPAPGAGTATASAPAADPVKTNTLSAVLGLVKPEEAGLKPPTPRVLLPRDDEDDAPAPRTQRLVEQFRKPETPPEKPAEQPAAPAAPADKPIEPTPAEQPPAETKPKVTVRKKADTTKIVDELKKTLDEKLAKVTTPAAPAPTESVKLPPPETPATTPPPADLLPGELEDYELALYAEKRDPKKKGLAQQYLDFFAKQKKFLETAAAEAQTAGEEYDPTSDPKYKKFLAANEPKLSRSERKQLELDRVYEKAKEDAAKEAEERLKPKLTELERRTAELVHKPEINQRVSKFLKETLDGMPEEVVKFHLANGSDVEKTRAEFPLEFEAVANNLAGARSLAEEFLSIKRGLKPFNPFDAGSNPKGERSHRFLNDFIEEQGSVLEADGGDVTKRDGKTFVHPSKWDPKLADKHWTFDDEDVLLMLRVRAQKDAKAAIEAETQRLTKLGFTRVKATPAPAGAPPAPAAQPAAKPEPEASPRTAAPSLPGAQTAAAGTSGGSLLSRLLGVSS